MNKASLLKASTIFVATGFGLGFAPVASGTFGTLPGIALVFAINYYWKIPVGWMGLIALLLTLLAVPICDVAEKYFAKKDDGRIVADEMMTFPICMIGLPATPIMLTIAFITSRVFDVLKPPPARQLQLLHGGLGIVIDDVIANIYALFVNHLLFLLLKWKGII